MTIIREMLRVLVHGYKEWRSLEKLRKSNPMPEGQQIVDGFGCI